MLYKNRLLVVLFVTLLLGLGLSGCYTQLARYESTEQNDDEAYVENETNESEEAVPDTIVVHKNRTDVYAQQWPVLPVLYDSWWYEPYWYYGCNDWWRWHHTWDPWYKQLFFLG